jgi:hypothetical protein
VGRASGHRSVAAAAAGGGAERRGPKLKWTDDRIHAELASIIGDGSVFPTQQDLIELGERNLASAVSRHGGAADWARRLSVTLRAELGAYSVEMAVADARAVIAARGHLPGSTKLRQLDHPRLAEKVTAAGGAAAFCARHGLPTPPATLRGRRSPGFPR